MPRQAQFHNRKPAVRRTSIGVAPPRCRTQGNGARAEALAARPLQREGCMRITHRNLFVGALALAAVGLGGCLDSNAVEIPPEPNHPAEQHELHHRSCQPYQQAVGTDQIDQKQKNDGQQA